ncbi:hypothetical protein MKX67_13965 [Cytobacillus sp. FSL W7-1323]|uniref:YodN n=1 Tax=Cytobacillus kochii TaxID=859143 RepID=A0A248TMF6_9BACI|nr:MULTISPECIES: hypothetical protein [Cytobacillus]ASV69332.1 hypothetical protein CKF48_19660 [Cytobacillus kochii]MDQ0184078.1 hypothetical protein [Cytobacillus kochii]MEA1852741.1 hypothetical protein [Cytobacillus sp. OWB-43]
MVNRKKPKYEVGDTVVITIYGTVGKVTDVKWLDGMYVYEVNKSDGLYLESSLQPLSEFEGDVSDKEHVDIEYQYFFGDLVQVKGYGTEIFKVVGFRTEIWRYKEDAWEDVIYELSRISDGEWLEAGEEELSLLSDAEQADEFIEKLGMLFLINQQALNEIKNSEDVCYQDVDSNLMDRTNEEKQIIDGLLDIYNDYSFLYNFFQDEEYKKAMKIILKKLETITTKVKKVNLTKDETVE